MRMAKALVAAVVATMLSVTLSSLIVTASAQVENAPPSSPGCPPGQPDGRQPGQPPSDPGGVNGRDSNYPIGRCNLLLSRGSVARGERVGVAGGGCPANSEVAITLDPRGTLLGTVVADVNGAFSTEVLVPADAKLGQNQVTATCATQVLGAVLEVTPAQAAARQAAAAGGLLASTGDDVVAALSVGASLVVIGTAMVIAVRRRRRAIA